MELGQLSMKYITVLASTLALLLASCSDSGTNNGGPGNDQTVTPTENKQSKTPIDPPTYRTNSVFVPHASDIGDNLAFYQQDDYPNIDVIRIDIRVPNTTQGVCTIEDQSGCTFSDVLADVNSKDDFKVEIPIYATDGSLPLSGEPSNATLRQRGNSARNGPQKSFRIKLDSKKELWRNERRLQLNKNPFDSTRFKNKLAFDLFQSVPHFPSLRSQFVNLWIDHGQGPEDFGLFTHTEYVGKEYLINRGLNEDDNLYKSEVWQFSSGDLQTVQVDENGKPLDKDAFEKRLEIKRGNDHRALITMLEAMHDPNRTFDSVLDQHFNRNNVLTWLATNLILRQADAITHNFYLYNPAGTERFYFLPWDYDGILEPEPVLVNSFENEELQKRKFYGYARGINSEFISRFYRLPGMHKKLVQAIDELRANYYTDAKILEHSTRLSKAIEPFVTSLPDSQHARFTENNPARMVSVINQNYQDILNNYQIPMAPKVLKRPEVDAAGLLQLQWEPAFDVTGLNTLSYDIVISKTPQFEEQNILFTETGIPDVAQGLVSYPIRASLLPSGRVYVRVIARASSDPEKFWQTNSNIHRKEDGTDKFGMIAIELP